MQKAYNVLEQFLILTLLEKQKEIEEARAVLNDLVYLMYISGISKIELEKEPLSFTDPTGLLTTEQYVQRREQSEAVWGPRQDWWGDEGLTSENHLEVWFYGFYGGANYTAAENDDTIERNIHLFDLKPLNSVDATYRKHDWNGIGADGQFIDGASEQAIISNFALGRDLKAILDSRQVFDEDGVALEGKELNKAIRAARQSYGVFKNGGPGVEDFMINRNMSEEQFEEWKQSPATQARIEAMRNVKMPEATREWAPLENEE